MDLDINRFFWIKYAPNFITNYGLWAKKMECYTCYGYDKWRHNDRFFSFFQPLNDRVKINKIFNKKGYKKTIHIFHASLFHKILFLLHPLSAIPFRQGVQEMKKKMEKRLQFIPLSCISWNRVPFLQFYTQWKVIKEVAQLQRLLLILLFPFFSSKNGSPHISWRVIYFGLKLSRCIVSKHTF